VAVALPELDERDAQALALVALAGRPRAEVADKLGIGRDDLADALASGRKALRRTVQPLTASGWCERAERLISDRLDGQLEEPGVARLDVHLRNCPRCVEHERRLVQATDVLMAEAADASTAQPLLARAAAPVELTVIDAPEPQEPALPEPTRSNREVASGLAWGVLVAIAVILALASLALVVAGVLGANL
jgi:hypothetical protein